MTPLQDRLPEPTGAAAAPGRLLFVITRLDLGGAEVQTAALARQFASRGWQVEVVGLMDAAALAGDLEAHGIAVTSLGMQRGVPDPRAVMRLARTYRRFQPDVVHSHMVHANLLARAARLLQPVRLLISTAHNIDEGGRRMDLAYRLSDPACELTTNVSVAGLRRYREVRAVRPDKSLFMPNGVDLKEFSRPAGSPEGIRAELGLGSRFVWLAVGRFREQKDYPNMLRAFGERERDSHLLICGDGELLPDMKNLAHTLGLADRVTFLGLRSDVPALLHGADAYLMSSAWEGLPLVLLEAAAAGLPIVATDVGGNPDIVTPGAGILVPPGDHGALATAMTTLERTPAETRKEMGTAAREHVRRTYDLGHVVSTWESIYAHGLTRSSGPRRLAFAYRPDLLPARSAAVEGA